MAKTDKYSIKDLKREFPNDNACLDYLFNSLHSKKCSCGGKYKRIKTRKKYQCTACRFQIAPTVGTIFEKSSTPLTLWFHALFIFSNDKSGISAKEMERQLGVTYKTAWRILNLIREQLGQDNNNGTRLKGDVEMDEAYFGGRYRSGKYNKHQREAIKAKSVIVGAKQRGGDIKLEQTPNAQAKTLGKFLEKNIDPQGTRLLTDESNRYNKVAKKYDRFSVNHNRKEFVFGDIHVNNIEQMWSHIKRSIKGTHKVVSKQHLQSYLDGFAWHHNHSNDRERFSSLLGALVG